MRKVKVCLDAGHVGSKYNQSPVVKSYFESAMVWALHLKLKAQLEARGFEVVVTRPNIDTELTVYNRGAASKGCDLFLSLHSNACGTEYVDYPVVYRAYDNLNGVDTLALKLARKVGELMDTAQAGRTATRKNGSGGEYYGVLRGARAVGTPLYMLIEHSFHTNTRAAKWLCVDANLDKLAIAEAELLAEHFGTQAPPAEPDPLDAFPTWQTDGLKALMKAGVIDTPEYWAARMGEAMTVGEVMAIAGKVCSILQR